MEIFRDANNNFQIIFPLTDRTVGDFVTGMAAQLDVNTILPYYYNLSSAWVAATFSGTVVEIGSKGYYHMTFLTSWFTSRNLGYPITVMLIDDAGTKQWKDQSIIIQPNLEVNTWHVTRDDGTPAFKLQNTTGLALSVISSAGKAGLIDGQSGIGLDIQGSTEALKLTSDTTIGLSIIGNVDGMKVVGTTGKALHLQSDQQALHLDSLTSGIGLQSNSIKLDNTGFAVVPLDIYAATGKGFNVRALTSTAVEFESMGGGGIGMKVKGHGNGMEIDGGVAGDALRLTGAGGSKDISAKEIDNLTTKTNAIHTELPIVGPIASQGDVQALSNNTRVRLSVPTFVQIPESGDTMIPIQLYYFDAAGDPADPDNNEVSLQARAVNGAAYKIAFFDDEAGVTGATVSTTFTPNYFKLVKLATGQYQTFYKLPSTENTDIWALIFKLEDTAVELAFPANMGILEEVPVLTLDDSSANRQIIAKSMKIEDVAGESPVSDSVYKDIIDDTNAIVSKLPSGNISGLDLTSIIDGQTLEYVLELVMALVNGRYLKDSPVAGQLTIFKRDSATVLTIIQITETEGTRIS